MTREPERHRDHLSLIKRHRVNKGTHGGAIYNYRATCACGYVGPIRSRRWTAEGDERDHHRDVDYLHRKRAGGA